MAASSRRSSGAVLRSDSSPGKLQSHPKSSAFASSTSTFRVRSSSAFLHRSSSPTRVDIHNASPAASSYVRFSLERSASPNRSMLNQNHVVARRPGNYALRPPRKSCMCSPTNHPGSFRCSLHKNLGIRTIGNRTGTANYSSNQLNMRRSAMTNSLVRIGTVEGDLMKRTLTALIRPSSHQQRRRANFRPRPSRLSVVS